MHYFTMLHRFCQGAVYKASVNFGFSVFAWGNAEILLKASRKIKLVGKAELVADLRNGQIRAF